MNRYIQNKYSWIEACHALRGGVLDMLRDSDLAFRPGGQNMSLGALLRESGEIEHSYVGSLKTFKQDWSYRNAEAELETSVTRLRAWYQMLDDELKAVVSAFSDEDLTKQVERSGGNLMPVEMQLDVYLQALLIFLGKASIYLKAMNKPLPEGISEFIG